MWVSFPVVHILFQFVLHVQNICMHVGTKIIYRSRATYMEKIYQGCFISWEWRQIHHYNNVFFVFILLCIDLWHKSNQVKICYTYQTKQLFQPSLVWHFIQQKLTLTILLFTWSCHLYDPLLEWRQSLLCHTWSIW